MAENEENPNQVASTDELQIEKSQSSPAQPDENEDVDLTGGVSDGTVEKTDDSVDSEARERIEHAEKIVHETDGDGNVVGWHKEAVEEGQN